MHGTQDNPWSNMYCLLCGPTYLSGRQRMRTVLFFRVEAFDSGLQELDKLIDVEVVSAAGNQLIASRVKNHVVGLRIDSKLLVRKVGVDLSQPLEYLPRFGSDPILLRQLLFVVGVERDNDEIIPQPVQNLRVGPDARLHLPTVDAAMSSVVDKERFVDFACILQRLLVVEEALQPVGQAEKITVFRRRRAIRNGGWGG